MELDSNREKYKHTSTVTNLLSQYSAIDIDNHHHLNDNLMSQFETKSKAE